MNEPRRVALIGFGFIGAKGHVPGYERRAKEAGDVRVTAVADICPERRALARKVVPEARIYSDYRSLLEGEIGRSDVVDIATPPNVHAEIARAALARGFHVLCEKPFACSVEEAVAMTRAATSAKRVLFPCHNYKHAPVVRTLRKIIAEGTIGRVHMATLSTFRTTHAKGVPEWNQDWRRQRAFSGGGIAMDHGPHTFYLAFDWLGAFPSAITAKITTLGNFDTEDNFSCALTFPTGTVQAHLSWTAGVREVIYSVHGNLGAVVVDDDVLRVTTYKSGVLETVQHTIGSDWMDASHAGWFSSLFGKFQDAIAGGEWVSSETVEAVACIQVIAGAYASAAEGCREIPLSHPEVLLRAYRAVPSIGLHAEA